MDELCIVVHAGLRLAIGTRKSLMRKFWRYPIGAQLIDVHTRKCLRVRAGDHVPDAPYLNTRGRPYGAVVPNSWGA